MSVLKLRLSAASSIDVRQSMVDLFLCATYYFCRRSLRCSAAGLLRLLWKKDRVVLIAGELVNMKVWMKKNLPDKLKLKIIKNQEEKKDLFIHA